MTVIFPHRNSFIKRIYYDIHCKFLLNQFEYLGYKIEYSPSFRQTCEVLYEIILNGTKIYVDFSDHKKIHTDLRPLIKCHLNRDYTNNDILPFAPISFYDWEQYFTLESSIKYQFGNVVLNNQTPGGNALQRRIMLRDLIMTKIPKSDTTITDQLTYWNKINTAKVAIFAPGARIDILDRGHLQYLAFGCCTISPEITDRITFGKQLIPNVHYIKCADDFSDVIDIVNSLNKNHCLEIGENAKKLFKETCLPHIIIDQIKTLVKS